MLNLEMVELIIFLVVFVFYVSNLARSTEDVKKILQPTTVVDTRMYSRYRFYASIPFGVPEYY